MRKSAQIFGGARKIIAVMVDVLTREEEGRREKAATRAQTTAVLLHGYASCDRRSSRLGRVCLPGNRGRERRHRFLHASRRTRVLPSDLKRPVEVASLSAVA